jgi:hypothetical protein
MKDEEFLLEETEALLAELALAEASHEAQAPWQDSLESAVRRRIQQYECLFDAFWADAANRGSDGAFFQGARAICRKVLEMRSDLWDLVRKYDSEPSPLPCPQNAPPFDGTLPPRLLQDAKRYWYLLEAIHGFLAVVHARDMKLSDWRTLAKRPGTKLDLLTRSVKDRVKYPTAMAIVRQIRAVEGWNVVDVIGNVLDEYPNRPGVSESSVARAACSKFLSRLQSLFGEMHVWNDSVGLLIAVARAKARDSVKDIRQPRVTAIAGELEGRSEAPLDELAFEEALRLIEKIKAEVGAGVPAAIVSGIAQGEPLASIARRLGISISIVQWVDQVWRDYLEGVARDRPIRGSSTRQSKS